MIEAVLGAQGTGRVLAGLVGNGQFTDPANARIIWLMAGGLVLLAVLVAAGTVWWWRSTEVEHPALGPLEVMGSRKWWKSDYTMRARRLQAARPAGAEAIDAVDRGEPVDLAALERSTPPQFDDLFDEVDLSLLVASAASADAVANVVADAGVDAVADAGAGEPGEPPVVDVGQSSPVVAEAVESDAASAANLDDATAEAPLAPIDPLLRLSLAETDSE